MMDNTIRFEQAAFIHNEVDKIEQYTVVFQSILRVFSKSPLLQMVAGELWWRLLDLSKPYGERDFSQFLFDESDKVFKEFEELQNNPKMERLKEELIKVVKEYNKPKDDI